MFATLETTDFILCGVAVYFAVATVTIVTAGVCAWLFRQLELANSVIGAGGEAAGASAPAVQGHFQPVSAAPGEASVLTAA